MKRSSSHFGLDEETWQLAVDETRRAIIEAAANRRMTCYSEVAATIECASVDPYSALMNHLLGAVFEEESRARRPALTSIVTHKSGDLEPGRGFYDMARSLGYVFNVPFEFWAEQVQEVFKLYGRETAVRRRGSAPLDIHRDADT